MRRCLEALEANRTYASKILCEPQMGKRNLYPTISMVGSVDTDSKKMMDLIAYIDGKTPLLEIAETIGINILEAAKIAEFLWEKEVFYRIAPLSQSLHSVNKTKTVLSQHARQPLIDEPA